MYRYTFYTKDKELIEFDIRLLHLYITKQQTRIFALSPCQDQITINVINQLLTVGTNLQCQLG